MVFSYYKKLNVTQKKVYRKSDEITSIPLPHAAGLHALVVNLEQALTQEDRVGVEKISQTIATGITDQLSVPPIRVRLMAVRPAGNWGELHGLYEAADGRASAVIKLWMRTVKHKRVVAFRSFLRTLLHELCHHLDYKLFKLADSFHTEGFYKRESSLFHQLTRSSATDDK
jgi:hypothetical protein